MSFRLAQIFGDYGEGEISLRTAFLYVQVTNAISQIVSCMSYNNNYFNNVRFKSAAQGAMVFLNIFYRGTRDLLKPINPRLKFAVIQAIIFVTSLYVKTAVTYNYIIILIFYFALVNRFLLLFSVELM